MDLGLKNKNVLVTGGSKGIGLAVAELFAAEGANVAICARNANEVAAVVKKLAAHGGKSWGQGVDVADAAKLKQWVEGAAAEFGGIDAIGCNVSALAVGDTPETWERSFRVDMMHTVNAVAAAMPYLEKSKAASIVIVSSVSGFEVDFAAGSYGAFKAALIHYAKGLSNQLAAKGIRVNAVSPGNTYFEGGIWQNIEQGSPDLYRTAMSLNPTGRMGTPQEVAAGVVFLASPVASRISGTNLITAGALTLGVWRGPGAGAALAGAHRQRPVPAAGDDLGAQFLDGGAALHGGSPDQRKGGRLAELAIFHQRQHRGDHQATGAHARLQLLDARGGVGALRRDAECHDQRAVEAGGPDRLDQERGRLEIEQPFEPARRLGADQGDDRNGRIERQFRRLLDRKQIGVEQGDIGGLLCDVAVGRRIPCVHADAEAVELAANGRELAFVARDHQRGAAANRERGLSGQCSLRCQCGSIDGAPMSRRRDGGVASRAER